MVPEVGPAVRVGDVFRGHSDRRIMPPPVGQRRAGGSLMMTCLVGLAPKVMFVGLANLDIGGWLVGPEVRAAIASFLASFWTAITSLFLSGYFTGT